MKRFSPAELALFCVPLAIPLFFFGSRRLLSPRDSNAKIVLTVVLDPNYAASTPNRLSFGWKAKAQNSPQSGIDIRYSERIVASGHGNSQVVYGAPIAPAKSLPWAVVNGINQRPDFYEVSQGFNMTWRDLPLWADKLEWQGEVVAIPQSSGYVSKAATPSTLKTLAQVHGAARVIKKFPIAANASQWSPVQKCYLQTVNAQNKKLGADTCVTVDFKQGARKVFRQLTAFDGRTRRVLWSENADYRNHYWISEQIESVWSIDSDSLLFDLKAVPASWGKITFSLDAVFAPKPNAIVGAQNCDQATIQKLKSQGWIHESRQLIVRS